jgi:hypothetical protein
VLCGLPGTGLAGGVVASSVALVAVRRAFACDAPQAGVDGQSERAHGGDRGRDTGPAFFLAGVVGQVVDAFTRSW